MTKSDTFVKTIWVSKKPDFEQKVSHLNSILKKQGKPLIAYRFENYRSKKVTFTYHRKGDAFRNDEERTYNVEVCDAVCSGTLEVKKDDQPFTYIGSVSLDGGIRQVFCKDENFARFFMDDFRDGYCDHCHSRRMNRKSYHLFAKEDGTVLQIGSTCAKEYFGIDSTAFLETYGRTFFVSYEGCEDDLKDLGRGCATMPFGQIVPFLDYATSGFLRWNKKSQGYSLMDPIQDWPTVDAVRSLVMAENSGTMMDDKCVKRNAMNVNLSIEDCVSFWEAKKEEEGRGQFGVCSTFTFNILETLKAGYATDRSLGSFCYGVFAAYNARVRQLQASAAPTESVPCRFPKGTRTVINGTIVNVREFEDENPYSYNGEAVTKYTVDFKDDAGTLYHFTTSSATFAEVENGSEVSIRAKVEDTKEYKGTPYTRLSRPVCIVMGKKVA